MKRTLIFATLAAMFAVGCQKDFNEPQVSAQNEDQVAQTFIRSYDEALKIAEEAVAMVDDATTRTSKPRKIMSNCGQIVTYPVTRSGETSEEPIMYIFNNEDNAGFTVVAANRSYPSLIATTELGNYTYGESTGVEPFDLMMEDMVATLSALPNDDMAIKTEIQNDVTTAYNPNGNIRWGTTGVYGSLYPSGEAFVEAAAIAQALVNNNTSLSFTVTIDGHSKEDQTVTMSCLSLKNHINNSHSITNVTACNATTHNNIALLYREIGERLSNGKANILNDPSREFTMSRIYNVLDSFDCNISDADEYVDSSYSPRVKNSTAYYNDILIMQGELDDGDYLHNDRLTHTWLVNGLLHRRYDLVTFTLNKVLNPNHINPNGYTETNRVRFDNFWYHVNWCFDGMNNGWFSKGCFDMANRDTNYVMVGGHNDVYDYNFDNIEYMVLYE